MELPEDFFETSKNQVFPFDDENLFENNKQYVAALSSYFFMRAGFDEDYKGLIAELAAYRSDLIRSYYFNNRRLFTDYLLFERSQESNEAVVYALEKHSTNQVLVLEAREMVHEITKAQQAGGVPDASSHFRSALQKAKEENKKVFVVFTASWCGFCKALLLKMKYDNRVREFFRRNYVIQPLVVMEEPEANIILENKGGISIMKAYNRGRETAALPYWFITDDTGKLLHRGVDAHGKNLGCPLSSDKSAFERFVSILEKTSDLSSEDITALEEAFKNTSELRI